MKTTIKGLSNERLEAEISHLYHRAAREAPGVKIQEKGLLADMWEEFDGRLAEGTMPDDTDWTPKEWREGYYE